ncbi:TIGR01777 family oxidoreductase [Fredinandcohnia quinoae]|uniref:TIGR01777 family oxidoreductase n=1 Tax=Fredinandcohnia quinoae TaxID=2918902 RepID=A0AAW5E8F5_9BACI|nr:TIGR01777 family oxidoreductase [Fredinandcohnia sp. SECRCQ15]MCH1627530.1 TIGR01777 family oxidoreductase [Fredinandcohnia sp. SECRCQ15]
MKIAIAGGTGFVGEALANYFLDKNHTVYILTRNASRYTSSKRLHYLEWLSPTSAPEHDLQDIDAFINLAGESLNSGRWTKVRKQRIVDSRITATKEVIRILKALDKKPECLINASAIGVYGTSVDETFTEDPTQVGTDFLADTVSKWEEEAQKASGLGIRTVFARFGVILGKDDGALPRMVLPYRFFIGGTVGVGNQWLSWIHIIDVVKSIEFLIENQDISGPVNLTSPDPKQMKPFGKAIGKVLGRPHWLPVPGFALKLLLGEMSILVLEGQKVLPKKLQENHYPFTYVRLEDAIQNLLK